MDIFGVYLSLSVLLITSLALNISRLRIKEKIANGDGKNKTLVKAIRAHMNALEHIIPFSIVLFMLKGQLASTNVLTVLCFGFLAVRVAHSYSMLHSQFRLRQVTAAFTYFFEFSACLLLLYVSLV